MAKWDISRGQFLYVLWRVDGDFFLTKLSSDLRSLDRKELLIRCIQEELEDDEVEEQVNIALDTDHPDYIGYEMPVAFISTDVEFLQT